jgi:hypothetical protein
MHVNIFSNGDQALHCGGCDAEIEKEDHYITLVGKELNQSIHDISFNAASNDRIVRTTIDWFESGNTADFAIIHFTEDFRLEYVQEYNDYQTCTPFGVKNHQWPPEKYKDLEYYYDNVYTPFLGSDNYYKNQFLLELYFEKKNIPYFFLTLMKSSTPSPWKAWCKHQNLRSTHYMGGLIFSQEKKPENYHHHHPSEKGHQIIADYILENIREHFI